MAASFCCTAPARSISQCSCANARAATADLGPLRADVESNLRKVEQLVNEINRKWPFKRNPEIKLP